MSSKMKSYYICSAIGCVPRNVEAMKINDYLQANGLEKTEDFKKADMLIINTCANGEEPQDIAERTIKYYHSRKGKKTRIIVIGCLPKIKPEFNKGWDDVSPISPRELEKFDELISADKHIASFPEPAGFVNFPLEGDIAFRNALNREIHVFYFNARADILSIRKFLQKLSIPKILRFIGSYYSTPETGQENVHYLKVSVGCPGMCSYCIEHTAIGDVKSRQIDDIIKDFNSAYKAGYRDFVVCGDDTAYYGSDIDTNIAELLKRLLEQEGSYNISIGSLNPEGLIKHFQAILELLRKYPDRIRKMHVPIQSGSNRILKKMNRGYRIEDVKECLEKIKDAAPKIKFWTAIIAGFPGETEEDFLKSARLLEETIFSGVFINTYSDRKDTKASKFKDKISRTEKTRRVNILQDIQKNNGDSRIMYY